MVTRGRTGKRSDRGYVHVERVDVYLWGRHVAAVALDPSYGYYAFAYTKAFCDAGVEPAPPHMPAAPDEVYLFVDLPEATYKRLPALLRDALPDDFGNALIDRYMASAGGARAQAVIAWNPETQEIRTGQLAAPAGFEHWLLKFDGMGNDNELGMSRDYGRIEYACHLVARAAGIAMSDCRLLHEGGRSHFMTRRFDRGADNVRHHMQTLCAMAHLDYKRKGTNACSQLFGTIREMRLPAADMDEAFRRMAFNGISRNCDDHTKNFSFLLKEGQPWRLSPAYDVTFAHNPAGEWTNQHLMSVNGKFARFERADLIAEADRFGVGDAKNFLDKVQAAIAGWPEFARIAGVSDAQRDAIGAQHLIL